jgi:hypothetical protein
VRSHELGMQAHRFHRRIPRAREIPGRAMCLRYQRQAPSIRISVRPGKSAERFESSVEIQIDHPYRDSPPKDRAPRETRKRARRGASRGIERRFECSKALRARVRASDDGRVAGRAGSRLCSQPSAHFLKVGATVDGCQSEKPHPRPARASPETGPGEPSLPRAAGALQRRLHGVGRGRGRL